MRNGSRSIIHAKSDVERLDDELAMCANSPPLAIWNEQIGGVRCAETADTAVVTILQPTMHAGKVELICVDRAAIDVVHLAVSGRCVGDLLEIRRLLAIVADPLANASRHR